MFPACSRTLKPEYRDALRVVDLEDGKLSDLAEQSGITAENAAVRVHRARKALRRRWNRRVVLVRSMGASIATASRRRLTLRPGFGMNEAPARLVEDANM